MCDIVRIGHNTHKNAGSISCEIIVCKGHWCTIKMYCIEAMLKIFQRHILGLSKNGLCQMTLESSGTFYILHHFMEVFYLKW